MTRANRLLSEMHAFDTDQKVYEWVSEKIVQGLRAGGLKSELVRFGDSLVQQGADPADFAGSCAQLSATFESYASLLKLVAESPLSTPEEESEWDAVM